MSRLMFDSITARDIPSSAAMVAGYVDGSWAWSAADWARFPSAVKVRIAVGQAPRDAQVCDVERGDYLPWESVDFVLAQRAKGIDPTVYVNLSNWNPTITEFRARGVAMPHWWLADYDGVALLWPGAVAKQYINPPGSGGHFDLSVVADFWPGIDAAAGGGTGGEDMTPEEHGWLQLLVKELGVPLTPGGVAQLLLERTQKTVDALSAIKTELDQIKAAPAGAGGSADATALQQISAKLDRVIAELHTP